VKLEQLSLILSILTPMIDNIIPGQATTILSSNDLQHLESIKLSNSDKTDLLIAIENNRAK
jgi:hypothetical protein